MTENNSTYRESLKEARSSFDQAKNRKHEITLELVRLNDDLVRLRRTITALAAMCSESPGFDKMGITDACIEVMENTCFSLSTSEVVDRIEEMGFDIASQKNANASVHAVLARLAKNNKITKIETVGDKVFWRGPKYDAKIDAGVTDEDIPF